MLQEVCFGHTGEPAKHALGAYRHMLPLPARHNDTAGSVAPNASPAKQDRVSSHQPHSESTEHVAQLVLERHRTTGHNPVSLIQPNDPPVHWEAPDSTSADRPHVFLASHHAQSDRKAHVVQLEIAEHSMGHTFRVLLLW